MIFMRGIIVARGAENVKARDGEFGMKNHCLQLTLPRWYFAKMRDII